jgi:hypothetical protein
MNCVGVVCSNVACVTGVDIWIIRFKRVVYQNLQSAFSRWKSFIRGSSSRSMEFRDDTEGQHSCSCLFHHFLDPLFNSLCNRRMEIASGSIQNTVYRPSCAQQEAHRNWAVRVDRVTPSQVNPLQPLSDVESSVGVLL